MTRSVYVLPAGRLRWEVRVEQVDPCPAALNIKGEHFPCQETELIGTLDGSPPRTHEGWAHSNRDAQAIWQGLDEGFRLDRAQFYRRKAHALIAARAIALVVGGEVQPHNRLGRIQDPSSFGNDPRESAG